MWQPNATSDSGFSLAGKNIETIGNILILISMLWLCFGFSFFFHKIQAKLVRGKETFYLHLTGKQFRKKAYRDRW